MSKTPEQLAEEHANIRCPEQGPEFIVWCMCKEDFLTGYQAAKELYEAKIQELEIQLENWQHNAIHGDEGR